MDGLDILNQEVQEATNLVSAICKKHGCWVVWEKSDPWCRRIAIDGPSDEAMTDCAEELEQVMNQLNEQCSSDHRGACGCGRTLQ